MIDNFDKTLQWVLAHEGGYVNHPRDPGGATNQGVTYRVYDAWRRSKGMAPRDVRHIAPDEVKSIYKAQYWDAVRGDDMPSGVDYAVFDYAVNSGPNRAAKALQAVVGVKRDGVIGAVTLEAVGRMAPKDIIIGLCEQRMAFLKRLKHWRTFGKGWTRRVMGESIGVQARDHGTIDRAVMLADAQVDIPAPAVRQDGAAAKSDTSEMNLVAAGAQAIKDRAAATNGLGVAGIVTALTQLKGPIAWALGAGLFVMALLAAWWIVKQVVQE